MGTISIFCEKVGHVWYSGATTKHGRLIACGFSPRNRKEALQSVLDSLPKGTRRQKVERASNLGLARRLHALFLGKRLKQGLRIDLSYETDFARRVYNLVSRIPRGNVVTYGGAAEALGSKRYSRAVGGAMANNPLPLIVPCHRVIPSTLSVGHYGLGHYPSKFGTSIKHELLKREGVRFAGDRVSHKSVWKAKAR